MPSRYRILAVSLGLAAILLVMAGPQSSPGFAQGSAPQAGLPAGSQVKGSLRRTPSGEIELAGPERERARPAGSCAAGLICVGRDEGYRTLSQAVAAAKPGATIAVLGGTYRESVKVNVKNVTIKGMRGTPHFDCTGLRLADDKACILLTADGVTLDNLEISGAVLSDDAGANGACIRNEPGLSFTVRHVVCHGSQDGMLAVGGKIVIEDSQFYDNGWTGSTHNIYLAGDCLAIVRGSTFRDARVGHEFKSRCERAEISDSLFRSTHGSRDLDIPDGGNTLVYRSTLEKTAGAENEQLVGFTAESCKHLGNMVLKDVKIVNSGPDASIRNFDKCKDGAIILQNLKVEGLPIHEFGNVIHQ